MPLFLKQMLPLRGIWKIEESTDELLSFLERKEEYMPGLASLRTEKRKQEWLATRVLLRELLDEEVSIAYHSNGAPFLLNMPLNISITHTNGYVAVLLQEKPFAGIDIEERSERVLRIRSRYMNEKEEEAVSRANEPEHLLIYWCAKETLFKMIGQEGVDFQTHLHISPFTYSKSGVLTARETRTAGTISFQLCYEVTPTFVWVWSTGKFSPR